MGGWGEGMWRRESRTAEMELAHLCRKKIKQKRRRSHAAEGAGVVGRDVRQPRAGPFRFLCTQYNKHATKSSRASLRNGGLTTSSHTSVWPSVLMSRERAKAAQRSSGTETLVVFVADVETKSCSSRMGYQCWGARCEKETARSRTGRVDRWSFFSA